MTPATSESSVPRFNLNFLPWRKASAARQTVETAVSQAAQATRVERVEEPVAAPRGSSYLPAAGALPLRFASARSWPDRMSPADEAALTLALAPDPDLAIVQASALAQGPSASGDVSTAMAASGTATLPTATGAAGGSVTIVAASSQAAQPTVIVARPTYTAPGEAILTADLVLHSLGNLSNSQGAVPAHFRPALPAEAMLDAVPVAVAP